MLVNEKDREVLEMIVKAIDSKFGEDVKILNVSETSSLGDYFVIASGSNYTRVRSMADEVDFILTTAGYTLRHKEGTSGNGWVLLDFHEVIVHLFTEEERKFYNLEENWEHSPEVIL